MSGGVGSAVCKDIPEENPLPQKNQRSLCFLSFRQLNCLAIVVIFAATGLVSLEDIAFVILSVFYILIMSKVAFPQMNSTPEPRVFRENNKLFNCYIMVGAIIGMILPIVYIFEGILEGDKEGIKIAAPHVFLLAFQVFMEGFTIRRGFSLPIRAFVPIFYSTRRVFTLVDWVRGEIVKEGEMGSMRRLQIGRGLAIANLMFWCFNLFAFLLPVYLPLAFKRYYGYKAKG